MDENNIDIIILTDIRAYRDAAQHLSSQASALLWQDCYMGSYQGEPEAALNIQRTKLVRCQMILAQPTWGRESSRAHRIHQ